MGGRLSPPRSALSPDSGTISPTVALYLRALDMQERSGYSYYDSLIVAAALEAGCRTLYTQELQHGRRFDSLTVVDPFAG